MANELDMNAYHSDDQSIDPGEHKTFNIADTIHSFNNEPMMGLSRDQFNQRFAGRREFINQGDTFNQRFEGEYDKLPLQVPGDTYDRTRTDLVDRTIPFPGEDNLMKLPYDPDSNKSDYSEPYAPGTLPKATFQPISDKQINPTMKSMRDAVVNHVYNMSDELIKSLHDTLLHPENLIGTGELGMARKTSSEFMNLAKQYKQVFDLQKIGKGFQEIADKLNIPKDRVKDILSTDLNMPKDLSSFPKYDPYLNPGQIYSPKGPGHGEPTPDWFKEEMSHTDPEEGLKALSDWYKNFSEGGPVEPEKLTLEDKIKAFKKKYGYDENPVSSSNDVEYTKRQEKLLTEIPELRQTPFHPDKQKEVDDWVKSLSYKDYQRMLNGDLEPPF